LTSSLAITVLKEHIPSYFIMHLLNTDNYRKGMLSVVNISIYSMLHILVTTSSI